MLNAFKIKQMAVLGVLTLVSGAAWAQKGAPATAVVAGLQDGTYHGVFRGSSTGRVHLFVRHIDGCDGCFIGTVLLHSRKGFLGFGPSRDVVRVYKAVPQDLRLAFLPDGNRAPLSYTFTPIEVDQDGELIPASNPSLVMVIDRGIGTNDVKFSTVQANNVNLDVFGSAMKYNGAEGYNEEREVNSGDLFPECVFAKSAGSIGMVSESIEDGTRFASVTDFGTKERNSSGQFELEEKAPGVFTSQRNNALATGDILSEYPDKIVIFMERGLSRRALLVDPKNPANTREVIIRH